MRVVRVEEATAGARVAKDILDLKGTLLFRAGTELTPAVIQILQTRSITHLFLEDVAGAAPAPLPAGMRPEEIDGEMHRLFADVGGHPIMKALRDSATRYFHSRVK